MSYDFKAIWCNLIGIKPTTESERETVDQWTDDEIDKIYDAIDEYGNDLYLHTVTMDRTKKSKIPDTNIYRHDIVLLAVRDTEQININEMLETQKLVDFDPITKHKLQNVPRIAPINNGSAYDSDRESDWDDEFDPNNKFEMQTIARNQQSMASETGLDGFDISMFDQAEIEQFMIDLMNEQMNRSSDNGYASADPKDLNDDTIEPKNDENENNCQDSNNITSDENSEDVIERHLLTYNYKRPQVYWWQTDELIVLKISAFDDVKYGLEVTDDQLTYG